MKEIKIKGNVKLAEGEILGIASTEDPDRHGDVIMQDGWDISGFEKNPVMLLNHNQWSFPIGKIKKIKVENGQLKFVAIFSKVTQEAREAYELVKEGILSTFSVGFRVLQEEWDEDNGVNRITKSELYEISLVTIPANPNAVVAAKCFKTNFLARKIADCNENESKEYKSKKVIASEDGKPSKTGEKAQEVETNSREKILKVVVGLLQHSLQKSKIPEVKNATGLLQNYLAKLKKKGGVEKK